MTWHAVYKTSDGSLQSIGQSVASDTVLASKGFDKIQYTENPMTGDVRWNPSTLVFDVQPIYRKPVTVGAILDLFTGQERETLFKAFKRGLKPDNTAFSNNARDKIDAFVEWMKTSQRVSLDHPYFIQSVNTMETVGIIGVGRAAEILA